MVHSFPIWTPQRQPSACTFVECKILFPVSSWIEDRFPHRSITHSLLATAAITGVSLLVTYFLLGDINFKIAIALPLGHLLACFSDTFTKQGVQLFYPSPAWAISVSNPRRRLKTGGAGELWVLGIAIALLMLGIHAELVGSSLKLNYCELERAIAYLREQYVVGSVEVKILRS